MSSSIPTAFVEGFRSSIYMKAQQKMPKFFGMSRNEVQNSETENYEILGVVDAISVTDRHGDTPLIDPKHTRRQCTLTDAEYATLIDKLDKVRMLINPENNYVKQGVMALNRTKDDVFIVNLLGPSRNGKNGLTVEAFPDSQKMVCVDEDGVSGATGMTAYCLTKVMEKFNLEEIDEDETKYYGVSPIQIRQMLNQDKITNADYAVVKALSEGTVNNFAGFRFIMSNRIPVTEATTEYDAATGEVVAGGGSTLAIGARRTFAWVESGMISATGAGGFDLFTRISERDDKRYSVQIYACHSVGAMRMEDVKVQEILILE